MEVIVCAYASKGIGREERFHDVIGPPKSESIDDDDAINISQRHIT